MKALFSFLLRFKVPRFTVQRLVGLTFEPLNPVLVNREPDNLSSYLFSRTGAINDIDQSN